MDAAEQAGGVQRGAVVDWAAKVGILDVSQARAVLVVARAGMALAPALQGAGSGEPFTALSSSDGWPEFIDDLITAASAVTGVNPTVFRDLPLDQFIDAVRTIAVALLDRNVAYIAGPVTAALQRVSEVAQAFSSAPAPRP